MSDHDFEKQVQARMEQLKLRPSDAVWAGVERNIRKDKRRRRMILWLPLLLLTLGAGGYFAMKGDNQPTSQDLTKQTTTSSSTQNTDLSTKPSTQTQDVNPQPAASKNNNTEPATNTVADKPAVQDNTTEKQSSVNAPVIANKVTGQPVNNKNEQKPVIAQKVKTGKPVANSNNRRRNNNQSAPLVAMVKEPKIPEDKTGADKEPVGEPLTVDSTATQLISDSAFAVVTPVTDSSLVNTSITDSVQQDKNLTEAAPVAQDSAIAQIKEEKKKESDSKWQWGVQAEAGYSGVTKDGLFGLLDKSVVADLAMSNAVTNYAPQFPRPVNKASSLTMGPAFSVGGFAQRTLSKRLKLSVGLQYTYLSARTVVGTKVNNLRTVNRAPATAQVVTSYYDANNTQDYTNRYHFIELPVTLHTQLNKGKRLPLVWDIGFSVSKLLNTTALHYDGLGGVYYKDNALFNQTQWVLATGFNFGIFQKANHPVLIGPMLRYNATGLLKKDYSTGQHLWSVGVRASMLLKK